MEKIRLGKTDMMVTRLGFGGIPIQRLNEDDAVAVVRRCLDLGINFFDTANGYTTSEERIGKAIKGRRQDIFIATKTGGRTHEEIEQNPDNIAARIIRLVHQYKKPTMVSVNVVTGTGAVYNNLGKTLDSGGVPTFLTANRAMYCLNAFVRYRMMRQGGDLGEWLK